MEPKTQRSTTIIKDWTPKAVRALFFPEDKLDTKLKQVYFKAVNEKHICVSVTRAGNKSFVYRRYLDKRWRELHLVRWTSDDHRILDDVLARELIKEARAKAAECHVRIEREEDPFTEAKVFNLQPTMQELFDHYQRRHLEKTAKRIQENVNNFERWFTRRDLDKRRVLQFTHFDACRLHEQMKKTPGSANRAVQLGRAMFNFGIKTRYITGENPFAGITLYPEHQRDRVLSDEEAGKLLKAISDAPDVHCNERTLADLLTLVLLTGVRKEVMLSMEWAEIDQKAQIWSIPDSKMKNRQAQIIPLGAMELSVLAERKRMLEASEIDSPWVFPSKKSKSGHLVDPGNAWETLRKRLGLQDVWIHDLRRSLASAMANSGANVAIVKAALNHTDMRTTLKAYIRTNQQAQLEARQKAQNGWFEAAQRQASEQESEI